MNSGTCEMTLQMRLVSQSRQSIRWLYLRVHIYNLWHECNIERCFAGDCCEVLGGDTCLRQIFEVLSAEAAQPGATWQGIESCLYAIRRIGRHVSYDESAVLPKLLPMLVQLPQHHQLSYTAILVVGGYADWVEKNPQYMRDLLSFVTARVGDPKIAGAACLSIRNLCDACRHNMVDSMDDLVRLYDAICKSGSSSSRDQIEVLQGVCYVVSELPPERLIATMQVCMKPLYHSFSLHNRFLSPSLKTSRSVLMLVL